MLDRSTKEIINICKHAVSNFEKAIKNESFPFSLFSNMGENLSGFKQLLEKIKDYQPNEAVLEIYSFSMSQNILSRLNMYIQDALFKIFNIDRDVNYDVFFGSIGGKPLPHDVLDAKMLVIKHELGIAEETDELLPSTLPRYY